MYKISKRNCVRMCTCVSPLTFHKEGCQHINSNFVVAQVIPLVVYRNWRCIHTCEICCCRCSNDEILWKYTAVTKKQRHTDTLSIVPIFTSRYIFHIVGWTKALKYFCSHCKTTARTTLSKWKKYLLNKQKISPKKLQVYICTQIK